MIGLNNRAMPVMARTHTMRKDCTPSGMSFWMQTTLRPGGERYSRKDSAGTNYCNTDLRVLPMHIAEASGNGASTHPSPHERILRYLCKPGPYLLLGPLLLPGGSLLVLLLYLLSDRAPAAARAYAAVQISTSHKESNVRPLSASAGFAVGVLASCRIETSGSSSVRSKCSTRRSTKVRTFPLRLRWRG
jgi:hypothetical protein